jgi:predicted MFS family arabinose efflux permease
MRPSEARAASRRTMTALLAASTLPVMANFCIAPDLAKLQAHFADVRAASILVPMLLTLPALVGTITAPLAGMLTDSMDKRSMLLIAAAIFAALGVSPYFLSSLEAMLATRLFLGIAEGAIMTAATALIADLYLGEQRKRFFGFQHGTMSLAGIAFLTLGGLAGDLGWREPFLLFGYGFVVAALLAGMPRSSAIPVRPGAAEDLRFPWKAALPVLAAPFFGWLLYYLIPAGIPYLLRERGMFSTRLAGYAGSSAMLCSVLASLTYSTVSRSLSAVRLLAITYGLMGVGFAVIAVGTEYSVLILGCCLTGSGFGLLMPNVAVMLLGRVPAVMRGKASAGIAMSVMTSVFCTPLLRLGLATRLGGTGNAFGAGAVTLFAASGLMWSCARRKKRDLSNKPVDIA